MRRGVVAAALVAALVITYPASSAAASTSAEPAADPARAREEARDILSERRFRGSRAPQPFRGVLHWLGERLSFVGRPFRWVASLLPAWLEQLVAAAVVVAAILVAARVVRARSPASIGGRRPGLRGRPEDPERLERAAAEAERRGDLEFALRLRFRAGLVRLAAARAIPARSSLTSGEVARLLRNPSFDRLASEFDEVVYGGRAPRLEDLETARRDWPQVVAAASAG